MLELTHLSMLPQNTNEVKLIESQQHNQFILSFTIIGRLLQMDKSDTIVCPIQRIARDGIKK